MQVVARLNNLRIAPRKVRLVTHSILGLSAEAALVVLSKQVKRSTGPMETLLKSAIANATNNFNLDRGSLIVKEVQVGDGTRLKRYMPRAMGSASQILRRSSKIKIVLEGAEGVKPVAPKKEKKVVKAAPEKKEEKKKEGKETDQAKK